MKVGTLVEVSAYGRNLKWLCHSFNTWDHSPVAIVLEHMAVSDYLYLAIQRLADGSTIKRALPRRAFRKAKVRNESR